MNQNDVIQIKIQASAGDKTFQNETTTIVVGKEYLTKGLDESFKNQNVGDEYEAEIMPEKAYGKRDPSLIRLISQNHFKQQNITPYPGLVVNIDGRFGMVRNVTSGRVLVDFNHPLAGKTIKYKIKILEKVDDALEKAKAITNHYLKFIPESHSEIRIKDENNIYIKIDKQVYKPIKDKISREIKEVTGFDTDIKCEE